MTQIVRLVVRETCKFGLAVFWIGGAAIGLHALGVITFSPLGQVRDPGGSGASQPVQRVKSESEIRAQTPEDRARAAHYDFPYGAKILETGDSVFAGPETPPSPPIPPEGVIVPTPPDLFQEAICEGDAVVVGRAVSKRVLLNRSETFLLTDHELEVYEWIRPSANSPRATVSVAGGKVQIGDRLVRAESGPFPDLFKVSVLILKRIPKANGYSIMDDPVVLPATDRSTSPASPPGPILRANHF
jgi:hypothetical protein